MWFALSQEVQERLSQSPEPPWLLRPSPSVPTQSISGVPGLSCNARTHWGCSQNPAPSSAKLREGAEEPRPAAASHTPRAQQNPSAGPALCSPSVHSIQNCSLALCTILTLFYITVTEALTRPKTHQTHGMPLRSFYYRPSLCSLCVQRVYFNKFGSESLCLAEKFLKK